MLHHKLYVQQSQRASERLFCDSAGACCKSRRSSMCGATHHRVAHGVGVGGTAARSARAAAASPRTRARLASLMLGSYQALLVRSCPGDASAADGQ